MLANLRRPLRTQESKPATEARAEPAILSGPLEQLVTDFFDEEQYEQGLTALEHLTGPSVIPSGRLIRQILAISLANVAPSHESTSDEPFSVHSLPRKRSRKARQDGTCESLTASMRATADAQRLLCRMASSSYSSLSLLKAICPPRRKDVVHKRVKRRRSSSHRSNGTPEEELQSAAVAVSDHLTDQVNTLWDLQRRITALDKRHAIEWQSDFKVVHRSKVQDVSGASTLDGNDPRATLRGLLLQLEAESPVEEEKLEEWTSLLSDADEHGSEKAFLLQEVLLCAFAQEREAAASHGEAAIYSGEEDGGLNGEPPKRGSASSYFSRQFKPDSRSSMPYSSIVSPMDAVFASLFCLDGWRSPAQKLSKASSLPRKSSELQAHEMQQCSTAAAHLLSEICYFAGAAVERVAMVRSIFERLALVFQPQMRTLASVFLGAPTTVSDAPVTNVNATPQAVLADACIKHLELDDYPALTKADSDSDSDDVETRDGGEDTSQKPDDADHPLSVVFDDDELLARRELLHRLRTGIDAANEGGGTRLGVRAWMETTSSQTARATLNSFEERLSNAEKTLPSLDRNVVAEQQDHTLSTVFSIAGEALALERRLGILMFVQQVVSSDGLGLLPDNGSKDSLNVALKTDLATDADILRRSFSPAVQAVKAKIRRCMLEEERYATIEKSAAAEAPGSDANESSEARGRTHEASAAQNDLHQTPGTGSPSRKSSRAAKTPLRLGLSKERSSTAKHDKRLTARPLVHQLLARWLIDQAIASVEAMCAQLQ
ncbi:unnamed protein product [Parajaminaea phylloscopi]